MWRYINLPTLLLTIIFLSACQLDAERVGFTSPPSATPTSSSTATFTPTSSPTPTPTVSTTPTLTPSPTASATATNTPTPTITPLPSDRLTLAQRAYVSGNYEVASLEFDALLNDPGADPYEKRLALHWRGRSELEAGDRPAAILTLHKFLQQYPTAEQVRAAQFNLGRAYEESSQPQEAVNAYLGAIIPADTINVYIYERIGDIRFRTGAYTETIAAYHHGINSTDDPGFKVHLGEGIAQTELLLHDDPAKAIAQYEEILKIAKIDTYRAKVLRLMGDTYLLLDDLEAAYEHYQEAVDLYPQARDSHLALIALIEANVPVDDFQRGLIDYHAQAYQPAIEAFKRYLAHEDTAAEPLLTEALGSVASLTTTQTLPVEPLSPQRIAETLWFMGLSKQALGQYNGAILTFDRLLREYPASPYWGEAYLTMGRTLIEQESFSRAKSVLRDFAAQQPDHALAPEALWRAAQQDRLEKLFDEAYSSMSDLADTYPNSQYASDALYWAGQMAYQAEDYEAAIEAWALLAKKYPKSELLSFGGYWRARALSELGRAEEAQSVLTQVAALPADYYVLRARDKLAGVLPHAVPLTIPTAAKLLKEQGETEAWLSEWLKLTTEGESLAAIGPDIKADPAFQRGDALLELGLRQEALLEFEIVKENRWNDALAMYQLAVYFREKGLGRLSIISTARLVFLSPAETAEDAPLFVQRLYYPLYFADVLFAEAAALEIDPALVAAIIRQESLFEESAQSSVGARGLMQVMPGTGEYVAEKSGVEDFDVDQLWLPYMSIKFGTWYINQQLGIFEGNEFAALAAYNAGPGNVLKWLETSADLDIFVESIPFRESRLYIRKIYVNLAAYRRLYGVL